MTEQAIITRKKAGAGEEAERLIARELDRTLAVAPPALGVDPAELATITLNDFAGEPAWLIREAFAHARKSSAHGLRYAHIAQGFDWARKHCAAPRSATGQMNASQTAFADACLCLAFALGFAVRGSNHKNRFTTDGSAGLDKVETAVREIVRERGAGFTKARSWIAWARSCEANEPHVESPIDPVKELLEAFKPNYRYGDHPDPARAVQRISAWLMGERDDWREVER